LLRFFDQVRFYPVSEAELTVLRDDFREGKALIRIEEERFALADYEQFLAANADSIDSFKAKQKIAYDREVALWQADTSAGVEVEPIQPVAEPVDDSIRRLCADISGNVWKVLVEIGQRVEVGQPLVILEAMKMEFPIHASVGGIVRDLHCRPSKAVVAGEALLDIALT
jgi:urea carboxylase